MKTGFAPYAVLTVWLAGATGAAIAATSDEDAVGRNLMVGQPTLLAQTLHFTADGRIVPDCISNGMIRRLKQVADSAAFSETLDDDYKLSFWLQVLRGHLHVGEELLKRGDVAGVEHIGHPRSEILTVIEPLLKRDFKAGLADQFIELEKHSARNGADAAFDKQLSDVRARIDQLEATIPAGKRSSREFKLHLAHLLMKSAAAEYEVAWRGVKLVNLVEYQDAWAFVQRAGYYLATVAPAIKESHPREYANLTRALAKAHAGLPGYSAPERPKVTAAMMHAVAAVFEINIRRINSQS